MAITKTKFIENETLLQVTVHTPVMWAGLRPQMHVILYPNGRTYALTEELLNAHFTIVSPQEIVVTAHGADGTDRPTQKQVEIERGDRVASSLNVEELLREPPVEDALQKARRLYAPAIEPLKED
jgi:hypothetical protein